MQLDEALHRLQHRHPLDRDQALDSLAGIPIEPTNITAIGQLADAGLRGGQAGRALRDLLDQLDRPLPEAAKNQAAKPRPFEDLVDRYGHHGAVALRVLADAAASDG